MFRTLRSKSRHVLPLAVGAGALLAGFLLLNIGTLLKAPATTGSTELAAATRGTDTAANRGSGRTPVSPMASAIADAAAAGTLTAPADEADPTATTVPPETTTTVAPTTTAAPTTTTTAAPKPKVTAPPAPPKPKPAPPVAQPPAAPGPIADDVWKKLAACESGVRNDLGAPYYGYFQFSAGTWTSLGGTGLPSDHTYDEQKAMAQKLQARSGWGQWPVCSRGLA